MRATIIEYLPIILPLFILQLILLVIALRHLIRNESISKENKFIWGLVIIFINLIGPIIYLVFGRKDD